MNSIEHPPGRTKTPAPPGPEPATHPIASTVVASEPESPTGMPPADPERSPGTTLAAEAQKATDPPAPVVLALGGTGCMAHLGFLRALEGEGVHLAGIAGASSGAVAAAAFAFGLDDPGMLADALRDPEIEALLDDWNAILRDPGRGTLGRLLRHYRRLRGASGGSLLRGETFTAGLARLFGSWRLDQSPLPLAVVAADLATARPVALRGGWVAQALRASCAIPGVLPAVRTGDRLLVDGRVAGRVPVEAGRSLADEMPIRRRGLRPPVVAVDASPSSTATADNEEPGSPFATAVAAWTGYWRRLEEPRLARADLVVRIEVPRVGLDAGLIDESVRAGAESARAAIPGIRELASAYRSP